MKLQITNDEQLYDLSAIAFYLNNLTTAIENYKNTLNNKEYYEKRYKRPEAAEEYYRDDLRILKGKVDVEVNNANASLISLGMEAITIEY